MAETVLSMARSLVGSAISKAASAAADETSLLLGVEKDICLAHAVCPDQLRMLRVLDLEDVTFLITQKDFDRIALLCHLKYLSIGYSSSIYSLPRSIGKLQGLQTLNMPRTYIAALPSEISKLQCLHTLRCKGQFH
uniref:Disease resistance R13L4/SHOC-2-like LRR domain-containing protein n=1 Tax=Oryza meridionalis TaxID=40149 RepID=A0A0E0E0Q8_9ORYZ